MLDVVERSDAEEPDGSGDKYSKLHTIIHSSNMSAVLTSDVLDVVERSDAEEPDSGGDDGDANDVFPDDLHGATSVGVRSEHDERNHQQQSPKPTPFHEKHVEHIVFVGHVSGKWERVWGVGTMGSN